MNVDHEFFCMRNLKPETSYEFRLSAQNAFGWSPPGLTSNIITTKAAGTSLLRAGIRENREEQLKCHCTKIYDIE